MSILPSFHQTLRDYAEKKISQRENFTLVKDFVVEVNPVSVKLKSGNVIPTELVLWSTGIAPRHFIGMYR